MHKRPTLTSAALGDVVVEGGVLLEEISKPTSARVIVLANEAKDPADLVGKPAVLTVMPDASVKRRFPLVVVAASAHELDTETTRYVLELEHPLALLQLRRDHRTFLDKSVRDIIEALLEVVSVKAEWKASRGTAKRLACVQYGESDYAFFARLLEEEGIFWFCPDDADDPKLVIADAASAFTAIAGKEEIPLTGQGEGMGVHELAIEHVVTTGAVALADYDHEKPGVDLTSRCAVDASPAGELFEYPGGYTTQADGGALAKIRAEEIASTKVIAAGRSNRPHLRAAATFTLTSESGDAPTGKYLVRSVEHSLEQGHYENQFVASPAEMPFRPQRSTPRPTANGATTATVTGPSGQEIHTDKLGRMTALYAFDRLGKNDDTSSQWMRVLQPALGGSMMLARVGWEMAVRHLDGDPDRPIAVARMYDGEHLPPEKLPATQTKTSFETLTSPRAEKINAITLDDKKDAMVIDVKAAKDLDATILHDETEKIGENDTLAVGKDSTWLIGDAQTVIVEKNDTAKASKDAGLAVAGNRTKTVTKDESVVVDGALSTRIDGNEEESVGKDLELTSDDEMLERAKGNYEMSVTGAVTAKAKKDYVIYVAGNSSETVGGAKTVSSSDGALTEATTGDVTLTIGGAWVETVDGNRISSAQGDMERTVSALGALTAAGKLQIKAKKITIKVTGAATFIGAGGVLSVTPASVALAGTITLKGSDGVEIAGAPQLAG